MPAALLNLLVVLAAAVASPVVTAPPMPDRWVTDPAGFLSEPARATLDAKLADYQRASGHQVVVWIGTSLGGAALDEFATRTFAAWKLGRAKLDDGLAMFVLTEDRTIAIEVGYGLEDRVPDAVAARIIREVLAPQLRAKANDLAITAGVDAVLTAIEGRAWGGPIQPAVPTPDPGPSLWTWILGGAGALAFLIFAITHPRTALSLLWIFGRGFGGGGGGGGGFGGGGGGRSGGGGARGSW